MMSLPALLKIDDPMQYKLHAARQNEHGHKPLDVFLQDKPASDNWNRWISHKHEFNRRYILALMDFYPEPDIWLFGGIYRVQGFRPGFDHKSRHTHAYDSILTKESEPYIGRLKIYHTLKARGRVFNLENRLSKMDIHEISSRSYTGPSFPGFYNISLSWSDLSSIVANKRMDWKGPLSNVAGVYLITLTDGRQYVGAAYGRGGIWNRWAAYAQNKDGGNKLMKEANDATVGNYIIGATFTVLDIIHDTKAEETVRTRETHWKQVLGSRVYGLNSN